MVLRKDIEARRLRWTITDTAVSRDSAFLLYSSISQYVHLVNLAAGAGPVHSISNITEVHEELDFLVRPRPLLHADSHCFMLPHRRWGLALRGSVCKICTDRALFLREYAPYTGIAEFIIPFVASPTHIASYCYTLLHVASYCYILSPCCFSCLVKLCMGWHTCAVPVPSDCWGLEQLSWTAVCSDRFTARPSCLP